MVRLFCRLSAIAIAFCILSSAVQAETRKWSGTELLVSVSGEITLGDTPFGFRGQIAQLQVLSQDANLSLVYTGPTLTLKGEKFQLWVSPQLVAVPGYWSGHDAFGADVSVSASYKERLSIFVAVDRWMGAGGRGLWLAFYGINANPKSWLNIGLHGEQAGAALHAGPHVGFTKGPFHFELQHLWGLTEGDRANAIRLVGALSF